jgi:VanZ family protein
MIASHRFGKGQAVPKSKTVLKYLLSILTVACALFIFGNSALDGDSSGELSAAVLGLLREAAKFAGVSPALITEHRIRKLAHFCEYAVFGSLFTANIKAWREKIVPYLFMILFFGLAVPVADELVQTYIPGRNGNLRDVMIDFAGFVLGTSLCALLLRLIIRERSCAGPTSSAK